ncbi:MAG: hypothetical protein ACFCBW_03625 [Candidatus Competibacterales bacterium]
MLDRSAATSALGSAKNAKAPPTGLEDGRLVAQGVYCDILHPDVPLGAALHHSPRVDAARGVKK